MSVVVLRDKGDAMRTIAVTVLALTLTLPALGWGKGKPEPITCPTDVAVALAETCPCDGKMMPNAEVQPWKNHGQYVSCMVRFRNALRKAGCLTADEKRTIARCAAKSTCGKSDTFLCCTSELGTCTGDPMPGDMTAGGTCSNDALVMCDLDADCTKVSGALTKDADACVAGGGTAVSGSLCTGCTVE
jgi:hypothetical protein